MFIFYSLVIIREYPDGKIKSAARAYIIWLAMELNY